MLYSQPNPVPVKGHVMYVLKKKCCILQNVLHTELQMTEWKSTIPYSSSSQSIALPHRIEESSGRKIFVFVISRNFCEIFNFVFCEIFLQICKIKNYFVKIQQNTKFKKNNLDFREIQELFLRKTIREITKMKFRSNPMQDWSERGGRRVSTALAHPLR